MPKDRKLLIVIADGAHVRFVRPADDNALHTEAGADSASAHQRSSDLGSDHPGGSFHSDSSAHHAMTPRHDPHTLEKEKFAKLVADQLNAAASRDEFHELVVVAPAHTLHGIQEELNTTTKALVVGTLAKDLVKTPDHELWPHVREWVRPVHRETM